MRIEESRIYRVYMSIEEFELFYKYTKDIGYGYIFEEYPEDEMEVYVLTLYDDMLDDCYELLKEQMYFFDMEGMRESYEEMRDLVNSIYMELR